jgi:hypothetical protein
MIKAPVAINGFNVVHSIICVTAPPPPPPPQRQCLCPRPLYRPLTPCIPDTTLACWRPWNHDDATQTSPLPTTIAHQNMQRLHRTHNHRPLTNPHVHRTTKPTHRNDELLASSSESNFPGYALQGPKPFIPNHKPTHNCTYPALGSGTCRKGHDMCLPRTCLPSPTYFQSLHPHHHHLRHTNYPGAPQPSTL